MIDRLFTAVLAFTMLSVGAASFASLALDMPETAVHHVQLERVVITAKRGAVSPVAAVATVAQTHLGAASVH